MPSGWAASTSTACRTSVRTVFRSPFIAASTIAGSARARVPTHVRTIAVAVLRNALENIMAASPGNDDDPRRSPLLSQERSHANGFEALGFLTGHARNTVV